MLTDLLRPFSFLTITHPTKKPIFVNWVVPAIAAAIVVSGMVSIGISIDVFGSNGLLSRLLGFIQSLPGFYIAALAAIATFNNRDMLKLMPGVPPIGTVNYNGFPERVPMSRRRFLSSMFAYLTALSICLTLGAVVMLALADPVKSLLPQEAHPWIKAGVFFLFIGFVFQMVAVTLWGLYYLGDKLHTLDAPSASDSQPLGQAYP